ncbi:MAG: hypothetical protein OXF50_20530 [Caldilineaceae bacterium]|nr:hypothetical protein [Caldilineaceae bacterium]
MKYQFSCSGTLEEIIAVVAALQASGVIPATPETTVQVKPHETQEFVSDDFMYDALTRVRLSEHTSNMLKVLYDAEGYVRYSELCDALGLHLNQLKGVMSRFSARFHGTKGFDGKPYFRTARHAQTGELCYQLTDELRIAVRKILGEDSTH